MTAAQFRKAALSHPGTEERSHVGHPDFRVGGRIFASLGHPNEEWGMVALPIGRQLFLTKEHEGVFVPASGAWGRSGYTMVHLPKARLPIVKQALADAVEHIASKTKNKTKKKSAKTSAAQTQASASVNQVARQKK